MQNFDLNLLASLDALLAEKNVTRAAKRMHVTQSTMSGILRRLRDQFDDELLIRNGRRYDLSPFAQSLAISVRQTVLQIDSTISAKPLFDPNNDRRKFRIMASDYSTTVYLSTLFRRLEKQAPHFSFDIVAIDSPLDHVRDGSVDLCITGNPYSQAEAAADQLLRTDTLFSEVYCCIVDDDHPLRGIVTLEQLFDYPHVTAQFAGVTMQTSELRVGSARRRANSVINVPTFNVIPALVRRTGSIGFLPSRMMEATLGWPGLRTLAVAFEMPSFTEHLIWHSRFAYDPAFCWLRSVMLGTT